MSIRISEAEARRLARRATRAPAPRKARKGGTGRVGAQSPGEAALAAALRLHGADLPAPLTQVKFAAPARKWASDFGWPERGLLVEVDGGQFAPRGGRHAGDKDKEKGNYAALLGYRVMHFSPQQIERDPQGCVELIRRALAHQDAKKA
jgi:very-short-patch-repair endonuclease